MSPPYGTVPPGFVTPDIALLIEQLNAAGAPPVGNSPTLVDAFNGPLGCALMTNSTYTNTSFSLASPMQSLVVDASNGPITITLPKLQNADYTYEISKIDGSANDVTIVCAVGDTCVGGGTSVTLTSQNDFAIVFASAEQVTPNWIPMASRIGGFPPVSTVAQVAAAAAAALNMTVIYQNTQTVQPADTNIGVIAVPAGGSQSNWTLTLPSAAAAVRQLVISRVSPVEGPPSVVTVTSVDGNNLYLSGVPSVGLSQQGDYVRLVSIPASSYWMVLGCRLGGVAG